MLLNISGRSLAAIWSRNLEPEILTAFVEVRNVEKGRVQGWGGGPISKGYPEKPRRSGWGRTNATSTNQIFHEVSGCNGNDRWLLLSLINFQCLQVELTLGQLVREEVITLSAKQANLIRERSISSSESASVNRFSKAQSEAVFLHD